MGALELNRRRWIPPLVLVAAGVAFTGHAGYLHAKARLAQYLIEDAWARTLAGEREVRPWAWADTWPVARLELPGTELFVLGGASGRNLAFGPVLHPASAPPGRGVTIMAGHRDTHFAVLRDLKSGAEVWLEDEAGSRFRYRVTGHRIVDSRRQRLPADTGRPVLLLVTCWPFDAVRAGGPLRYVVSAVPDFKSGPFTAGAKAARSGNG